MKTVSAKSGEVQQGWFLVDATNQILGRFAAKIASRLKGKHNPIYTPHVDTGDYMVIINADKVRVSGNKASDKVYYRHSGYPGGLKAETFEKLRERRPTQILEIAIKGMLPKNSLGRAMFRKLKVYAGREHPHTAQQPAALDI